MDKPVVRNLSEIDWFPLISLSKEYLDFLESEDYNEDNLSDYEHYIFESAVQLIFGRTVWDYIDNKMEEENE